MKTIITSKGTFPLAKRGGVGGYKTNAINDCCIGYFILKEDGEREYFDKLEDVLKIRAAYEEN